MRKHSSNKLFTWTLCLIYCCASVGFVPFPIRIVDSGGDQHDAQPQSRISDVSDDCGCGCPPGACGEVCCCGMNSQATRQAEATDSGRPSETSVQQPLPGAGISLQPLACNPFRIKQISGQLHYLPVAGAPGIVLSAGLIAVVDHRTASPGSRALSKDPPPPRRI